MVGPVVSLPRYPTVRYYATRVIIKGSVQNLQKEYTDLSYSIKVFRGPRANAELVPKFHVALHASHADIPMVILKISHCTNVTSKYGVLALQVGGVSDEKVKGHESCGTST
jgi:hypothetical protein